MSKQTKCVMEKLFQDVDCLCYGHKDTRIDVPVSSLKGEDKVLGLFFSAHWCPPCRVFTPNLTDWYTRLRGGVAKDKLEIVYISLDKDEKTFDEYYDTMPWLALPYKYREREVREIYHHVVGLLSRYNIFIILIRFANIFSMNILVN